MLPGYFQGKKRAEEALALRYPQGGVALRPGFIYGTRNVSGVGIPLGAIGVRSARCSAVHGDGKRGWTKNPQQQYCVGTGCWVESLPVVWLVSSLKACPGIWEAARHTVRRQPRPGDRQGRRCTWVRASDALNAGLALQDTRWTRC